MRQLVYVRTPRVTTIGGSILQAGRICYHRVGKNIVFSGIDCGEGIPNTITAALTIIRRVCREKERMLDYQYYDLQTHLGYSGFRPNEHYLFRLWLARQGRSQKVIQWEAVNDLPELVEPFLPYLAHRLV